MSKSVFFSGEERMTNFFDSSYRVRLVHLIKNHYYFLINAECILLSAFAISET